MVLFISKEVQSCNRNLRVIEKRQNWYHHKTVHKLQVCCISCLKILGEFGLAQEPGGLQVWIGTQLPCGFFYPFKRSHYYENTVS